MAINSRIQLLLVEDNPGDAYLIRDALDINADDPKFVLIWANRLAKGLEHLSTTIYDLVLLDLGLPDSAGLGTLHQVHAHSPDLPIVILTGLSDESLAVQAVQAGAQDCLVKGQVDRPTLLRVIRHAIERKKIENARLYTHIHQIALIDELTGLNNRRGFITLATQQMKLAERAQNNLQLIFLDVDFMKQINDTFGHLEGDIALENTAMLLRRTFRTSDVIGRMAGDEFAILAASSQESDPVSIELRLKNQLAEFNRLNPTSRYNLSLSIGTVTWSPTNPISLDELLARADQRMCEQKRIKKEEQGANLQIR